MGGLTLLAVSPVSILPLYKRPAFLKDVFTYRMSVHNPVLGHPVASAVPQPVGQESRAQVRPPAFTSGHVGSPTPDHTPGGWQYW